LNEWQYQLQTGCYQVLANPPRDRDPYINREVEGYLLAVLTEKCVSSMGNKFIREYPDFKRKFFL
jgi:hypothetical protein